MVSFIKFSTSILVLYALLSAQSYEVTLSEKADHNGWGTAWGTIYVVSNNLVTLAIVPKISGRIMQYDLGSHPSIYVDPDEMGKLTDIPTALIGGFRMLPSPQAAFGWPPPPEVDFNPYTCTVLEHNADSAVVLVESAIIQRNDTMYAKLEGVKFQRIMTLYRASTRVKVEMLMINAGSGSRELGIWDITQCVCSNNNSVDTKNIWVYFKKNDSSIFGSKGYTEYTNFGDGSGEETLQWKPDIAEGGIMGVQYQQKVGKIGADCTAGWISYVDRLDGYMYVKKFDFEKDKKEKYPDGGTSVQVYTYKKPTLPTLEIEVLGPVTAFGPGDTVKFVENWFAARSYGPVLDVTTAGCITHRLTADQSNDSVRIAGVYGIFAPGTVYAIFTSANAEVVGVVDSFEVLPSDSLVVKSQYPVAAGATAIKLLAYDINGGIVGTLDSVMLPDPVPISPSTGSSITSLRRTMINYCRDNNGIAIAIPPGDIRTARLFTINGMVIGVQKLNHTTGGTANFSARGNNLYILQLQGTSRRDHYLLHIPR